MMESAQKKRGQPESLSEIDSRKTLYTDQKLRNMALWTNGSAFAI
jgi:hypothetical protein